MLKLGTRYYGKYLKIMLGKKPAKVLIQLEVSNAPKLKVFGLKQDGK